MVRGASFGLRLTVALVLAVLIAVGAVALLSNTAAERHFQDYISGEMRPRLLALVPFLAEHYAIHESWTGAEQILQVALGRGLGRGLGAGAQPILVDASGRVVGGTTDRYTGQQLGAT